VHAADVRPVRPEEQTQSSFDLFLIYVGANIVATTFQVGASLAESFSIAVALAIVGAGSIAGAVLVAALAPVGPRLRAPSMIVTRAALGVRGAALVAAVLYVTNFAWIAINNVIAASALAHVWGGASAELPWAFALGIFATWCVALGPRAVALADRIAVPLMAIVAVVLTVACLNTSNVALPPPTGQLTWLRGLDVVVAYQVSWILMFADYSRYTKSVRGSVAAVFTALALTSLWMMPLGVLAARAAGSSDPGEMIDAVGLGAMGALLLTLATVTTNFVNIYTSSLAWKSLLPNTRDRIVVWSIGLIGTALSAVPGIWIERYTGFMVVLGTLLVPVGGVLIAHFSFPRHDEATAASTLADVYDTAGRLAGFAVPGCVAWAAGALVYFAASSIGGTLPSLAVSMAIYAVLRRLL
jgi:purine-cytosine permease-like protein